MENPIKKFTPEQKLFLSLNLYYSARELKAASIKKFYPKLSSSEIKDRVKKIFSNART